MSVPPLRVRPLNALPIRKEGDYVLYWMIAARRVRSNFALQRALELGAEHKRPVLVFEALRCGYRWASDRLHQFVLQGMADNAGALGAAGVTYYPYAEARPGDGKGLLQALAEHAVLVITDEFPAFFLPSMVDSAARQVSVRMESVDSNGLLPLRATPRAFQTADSFRRYLKKELEAHLKEGPEPSPLEGARARRRAVIPGPVLKRWPAHPVGAALDLSRFAIDHSVPPVPTQGGSVAAEAAVDRFLAHNLKRYAQTRGNPEDDSTSRLSPYLHFGHLGAHEVVEALRKHEGQPRKKSTARKSYFGLSESAEGFLDELVTWRELSYNLCAKREDYARFESLPEWAKATLNKHKKDPRPRLQTLEQLEQAQTPGVVFNAAQRQLVSEGWFHNRMRMVWGKKILEYTKGPEAALSTMAHLMGKYSLDGRNPCSWSGYSWVLGRFDRPWGPERPIFGTVRYMASDSPGLLRRYQDYVNAFPPPR